MKKHIKNEKTGITYTLVNNYYLPDFAPPTEAEHETSTWGRKRQHYLKNHKKALYSQLLMSGTLNTHLHEIDEAATTRIELLIKQMAEREGATEHLKATDQMKWVSHEPVAVLL